MLYVKKPIPVEAVHLPSTQPTAREYVNWAKQSRQVLDGHDIWMTEEGLIIPTLEGDMLCRWGNWLIKGIKGEIYPCDNEVFMETYDPVEEQYVYTLNKKRR